MITYLIYTFLTIISKFSLDTLYHISRFCKSLLMITFKYRKKIIWKNIHNSFPELKKIEIEKIIDEFYTFFSDTIFEIIKSINFNRKEIEKRVSIINQQALNASINKKKPIILLSSHYANWEWSFLRIALIEDIKLCAVYKPLSNHVLNMILLKIRSKFGGELISVDKWKYFILDNRNKAYTFMFISDQVPSSKKQGKRINFLNQSTLFHEGAEKTARLLNADVFYMDLVQIKKGAYNLELKPMSIDNITQEYATLLEKTIKNKPASWLWSHNRWKR